MYRHVFGVKIFFFFYIFFTSQYVVWTEECLLSSGSQPVWCTYRVALTGCFSVESNLHPALPVTCSGPFHLILPFLMWMKLAWQWQCFSLLPVVPLTAVAHGVLTATDGRGYWGWKPPCSFGSPTASAFRHILLHEAAVMDVTLKRWMAGPFVAVLPVWTPFTCTALPLFTYHNSMRRDGSQSEGTIVSAWQAAGETQLAVSWPCSLTLCKLSSLLSCLFTLTMVLQAAPLNCDVFVSFLSSFMSCLLLLWGTVLF